MARLTIQTDIDTFGATIIADAQTPMQVDDIIFFLADRDVNDNIFNKTVWTGARLGATLWIEGGPGDYNGLDIGSKWVLKLPCVTTTTGNITLSGEQTIDGVLTSVSRVLVKNQTDQTQNGIYVSDTGAWIRATDSDTGGDLNDAAVNVTGGGQANTTWKQTTSSPTLGSSNIIWEVTTLADLQTAKSDINNKNHIHFFNGRGNVNRANANGFAGRTMQINNFAFPVFDFETNSHPGLRDGWGSGRGGTFGLREINTFQESGHGLHPVNTLETLKHIEIRGCELRKGDFAKIRAVIQHNQVDKFIVERNFLGQSHSGEGFYFGATTAEPLGPPIFKNLILRDNIIVCTAAEAVQLQNLGDGSEVYNNVIFIADIDYRSAFQAFQDTGIQLQLAQGNVKFYNNVIVGHGTTGIHIFGEDQSGETPANLFGSGVPKIFNNVFTKGKSGTSFRIHNSFIQAAKLIFRNNDVVSVAGGYEDVGEPAVNYRYDIDQETVPIQIIGGKLPVGSEVLNPGESNTSVKHFNVTLEAQSEPQFVNSGFDNIPPEKVTKWAIKFEVGKFADESSTTSIDPALLSDGGTTSLTIASGKSFAAGHVVFLQGGFVNGIPTKSFYATVTSYSGTTLDLENISNRVGSGASTDWEVGRRIPYAVGEFVWLSELKETFAYNLYHCILAHDSAGPGTLNTRPNDSPTQWELIQWDSAGKNSKDPAYSGTPATDDFMDVSGDFRLVKGTPHHDLKRGLTCNEQEDHYTRYGWQWKQTEEGTIRDIPGAYGIKLILADYSYLTPGRFYRFWVERKDILGFKTKIFSLWKEI